MSVPILTLALLLVIAFVGRPLAYPVLMGFVLGYLGYLIYDMVHYSLHHIEFKSRIGRNFQRLHHFHDSERGFAISAPWLDKIFGTAP